SAERFFGHQERRETAHVRPRVAALGGVRSHHEKTLTPRLAPGYESRPIPFAADSGLAGSLLEFDCRSDDRISRGFDHPRKLDDKTGFKQNRRIISEKMINFCQSGYPLFLQVIIPSYCL